MNEQYEESAILFGIEGTEGEAGALYNYCISLGKLKDEIARDSIINDRIPDEICHLIGNVADAVRISNFSIAPDGVKEALTILASAANLNIVVKDNEIML